MTLPLIDSDPTAWRRTPPVRVSSGTSVAEARAHLRITGEPVAVVFAHGRPVGLVSEAALTEAVVAGRCDAPAGALMDYVAVRVDPGADAEAAVRTFTDAAWAWLRQRRDQ